MGRMAAPELRLSIDALKSQIGPVSTSAEAECWWPLALRIDDTIELGDPASQHVHVNRDGVLEERCDARAPLHLSAVVDFSPM